MKKILTSVICMCAMQLFSSIMPGRWNTDFSASLLEANERGVPLVVVWGNTGCSHCTELHALLETGSIKSWIQQHPVYLVSKYEKASSTDPDYIAARDWLLSLNSSLREFPFVGVYWKDELGTIRCSTAFTGRVGRMPVKEPKNDLAGQFVATLDKLIGEYKPETTEEMSFVTADTEDDRLEADERTECVYVAIRRKDAQQASSGYLAIEYPNASENDAIQFSWAAGETEKSVAVPMPLRFAKGKTVDLYLIDSTGLVTLDSISIHMVATPENAPINPHWIGEHTALSLPYGEWTMDFDTAKEKVRLYGGKLVAMFGGPLWCPNCVTIEDDIFSTKKFKDWAKKNKIVLVHFDQGQASSPSTPEGTARGRLLTLTQSTKGKSGASYLSRHGIDPDSAEVKAVIDRVTFLTDAWLAPETTAARLANPVVLLLNDEGTAVDARFQRQSEGYTMDLTENMYRLQDLVTLQGDDEKKGYLSTTSLTLAPGDVDAVGFHVNSRTLVYRLTDIRAGEYLSVILSSTDRNAQRVTLNLMTASKRTIASGTSRLITNDPLTAADVSEGIYLKVSSYSDAQSAFFGKAMSFGAVLGLEASEQKPEQTADFTEVSKGELKEINPFLFRKLTATVPVYETVSLGGVRLVGTLAVTMSASNRLSVKLTGERTLSFVGTWDEVNLINGLVKTELERGDTSLTLTLDAAGCFSATISEDGETIGSGDASTGDFEPFVGSYTVTFVDTNAEVGTAYLVIKVGNSGKASVSGMMPDGTTLSLSAQLSVNADGSATLPVFKKTPKGTFSAALRIAANAEATWGDEGNTDTINAANGCLAIWETSSDEICFNVYGGYWKANATPLEICELYGLSSDLTVEVSGETVASVTATKRGFQINEKLVLTSLTFVKSTGVFSGKVRILTDKASVSGTLKGVLLPGWIDCGCIEGKTIIERPFGSGTLYYKVNGVMVSEPVDLVAEAGK